MPQLWLTYKELAGELQCNPEQARNVSISAGWTRKHSSDGFTRVMMPPHMMVRYFARAAASFSSAGHGADERADGFTPAYADGFRR